MTPGKKLIRKVGVTPIVGVGVKKMGGGTSENINVF